eukprot:scaffold14805_cov121-Isochrysis_galbana.AAC.9
MHGGYCATLRQRLGIRPTSCCATGRPSATPAHRQHSAAAAPAGPATSAPTTAMSAKWAPRWAR